MLKIYNSLSGKKEIFKPRKGKKVTLFVCGPTTYDYSHLGHARTYIVFDAIAKYLTQKGYAVFYLQNITDIDDKIIARANQKNIPWKKLSRHFEKEYLSNMKALNITSVTKYARATAYIKEIISQIERLLKKGYAYNIADGIYYDISKFRDYGKLSKRTILQAEDAVSRIDQAVGKRNKGDFCLWKFSKPGEPKWFSPWGLGRPGWHIEDTAITEKHFGAQYDIHGGSRDLIFPHHEAEIAQMQAISRKKPLAKYWLHTGFLTVNSQKMAKSLGNFITIKDFLKKNSGRVLRLFSLKNHYRSPVNWSSKELAGLQKQVERIDEFVDKLQLLATQRQKVKSLRIRGRKSFLLVVKTKNEFEKSLENDFNTPKGLAVIFDLISAGNYLMARNEMTQTAATKALQFLKKADEIFGFIFWNKKQKQKTPKKILKLVKEREKYRRERNWKKADELRQKIKKLGWWIQDTKEGPKIKKI